MLKTVIFAIGSTSYLGDYPGLEPFLQKDEK